MKLRQRWSYYGIALVFLVVYVWAVERQSHLSRLPDDPRLDLVTYPARVDERPVGSRDELDFIAQGYRTDESMTIACEGIAFSLSPVNATSTFYLIVTWLNGLFFWIVSVLVFAPRMSRIPGRDLYWASLLYGLAVMVGGVYHPANDLWTGTIRASLRVFSLVLLPLLLLHLGLNFPQRRNLLDRWPRLMPGIVLGGLCLAALQAAALASYVSAPSPDRWRWFWGSDLGVKLFLVAVFSAGCASFFYTQHKSEQAREKEQAKWVLWGITIGAAPFIFLRTLPAALGGPHILPLEIARLFSIVIPAAFSFTVVRYKFLDIDIIIRRSLIYPLLAGVMAGIYLLFGVALGRTVEHYRPDWSEFVTITATLISVALFNPTRHVIARWVDRTFFKIRYSHRQSLAVYRTRIAEASSQRQLADRLRAFLRANLDPKRVAVVLRYRDQFFVAGDLDDAQVSTVFTNLRPYLDSGGAPVATVNSTSLSERERWDLPVKYVEAGFIVFQPLVVERKLVGIALLGEKEAERRYIEQDLELSREAAAATASCLERMNLAQQVVEESLARSRADEMSRFKTEFFSRVAHDLRSPLTSISWSARNLLDGIVGELTPEQARYLGGIEASANQLVRQVNNLLELTRMESPSLAIETSPVGLGEIVRETAKQLQPIAAVNDVRVAVQIEDRADPILGNREKLLEVVDNLVENAVRYAPPRSTVDITLSRSDGGRVELSVRDRGPGIAEEDMAVLFEPFQQGRPSPHSTQLGFGLGLHVVKTYVEAMKGEVFARNHDNGGALFTCSFPAWRPTEEST